MAETNHFRLCIRTPHQAVLTTTVRSVRVPTETGHVGIRPRVEPTLLAVEAGVVQADATDSSTGEIFVGTAGGLLVCDGSTATMLTPLAVVGEDEASIVHQIDDLLMNHPNSELEARATLAKLERNILSELRHEQQERVAPPNE